MNSSLQNRIAEQVSVAAGLYHRLILVVGPPRTGKTTALRNLSEEHSWPLVNVNLSLSERMLELTSKQRALRAEPLLAQLIKEHEGEVVILDNTEILFSLELQLDPLRLLKGLSRNRTVIAAWAGEQEGKVLTYANPVHTEFKRSDNPDSVIVTALKLQGDVR
jgi:predicted AAA+ superfamily ATPase